LDGMGTSFLQTFTAPAFAHGYVVAHETLGLALQNTILWSIDITDWSVSSRDTVVIIFACLVTNHKGWIETVSTYPWLDSLIEYTMSLLVSEVTSANFSAITSSHAQTYIGTLPPLVPCRVVGFVLTRQHPACSTISATASDLLEDEPPSGSRASSRMV
jgi:hypothetical protein